MAYPLCHRCGTHLEYKGDEKWYCNHCKVILDQSNATPEQSEAIDEMLARKKRHHDRMTRSFWKRWDEMVK